MDAALLFIGIISFSCAVILSENRINSFVKFLFLLGPLSIILFMVAISTSFNESNLIETKIVSMTVIKYENGGLSQLVNIDPDNSIKIDKEFNCYFPEGTQFEYKRYSNWKLGFIYCVLPRDFTLTPIIKENKQ